MTINRRRTLGLVIAAALLLTTIVAFLPGSTTSAVGQESEKVPPK